MGGASRRLCSHPPTCARAPRLPSQGTTAAPLSSSSCQGTPLSLASAGRTCIHSHAHTPRTHFFCPRHHTTTHRPPLTNASSATIAPATSQCRAYTALSRHAHASPRAPIRMCMAPPCASWPCCAKRAARASLCAAAQCERACAHAQVHLAARLANGPRRTCKPHACRQHVIPDGAACRGVADANLSHECMAVAVAVDPNARAHPHPRPTHTNTPTRTHTHTLTRTHTHTHTHAHTLLHHTNACPRACCMHACMHAYAYAYAGRTSALVSAPSTRSARTG